MIKVAMSAKTLNISIHAPRTGSDLTRRSYKGYTSISIHAPRTGSDNRVSALTSDCHPISIHAPRTGSDIPGEALDDPAFAISIHAPRTGSDEMSPFAPVCDDIFQSTLPARGATAPPEVHPARRRISIHAPRTGSDNGYVDMARIIKQFQSTLPARGATLLLRMILRRSLIFQSTLPARGATAKDGFPVPYFAHFNPRSPHGERQYRASGSTRS